MKLFEVLNSPVEWKWTRNEDEHAEAEFEIDGRTVWVRFAAEYNHFEDDMDMEDPPEIVVDIIFASREGRTGANTTEITNTGNEFAIFATVATITEAFIRKYAPPAITFSSKAHETSRVKLYQRFVKKLQKAGYENKFEKVDEGYRIWILVKK